MEEYKQGFVVSKIDGRDDSVEFLNGIKIFAGDVIGKVSEEQLDVSRSEKQFFRIFKENENLFL